MQLVRQLKIKDSGTLPNELHLFLKPTDSKSVIVGNSFSNQRISWIACEDKLAIINNANNSILLKIDLSDYLPEFSTITCGEEVTLPGFSSALLVLGCETNLGGLLLFYHPTLRRMVRIVEVDVGVAVINIFSNGYKDNPLLPDFLACMDGVLAVGGIDGSVILVDLHYNILKRALKSERDSSNNSLAWPSTINKLQYISRINDSWHSLKVRTELCLKTHDSLAILLNDKEGEILAPRHGNTYSAVTCLHYCPIVAALFVGFEVGIWQMWSILDFKLMYSSSTNVGLAVVALSVMEPCDDPRHYLYLWVGHSRTSRPSYIHRNASRAPGSPPTSPVSNYPPLVPSCQEPPFSLLYSLAFVKKTNVDGYGPLYSEFYKCDDIFELEMVQDMETFNSGRILSVNSLICPNPYRKVQSRGDEDIELLRVWSIVWECEFEEVDGRMVYVTLFDLNQWYNKMPGQPDVVLGQSSKALPIQDTPFLSTWFLPSSHSEDQPLSLWINPLSLEAFRFLNQLDCHYYPSNISFSFIKLGTHGICSGEGMSVVNEFKEKLRLEPAGCMTCPEPMFHTCLSLGILPNFDDTSSIHSITLNAEITRRYLLTICVENGLVDVILSCARYWYDSACTETTVSLDFLVDFLWDLFTTYNKKIDELCTSLFDYSGFELNYLDSVKMKLLNQHMKDIKSIYAIFSRDYSTFSKIYIVNHRYFAIDIRTLYVDLVIWFTSHNFLPESPFSRPCDSVRPYNFEKMKTFIDARRGKNPLLIDEMLLHWISGEVNEWKREAGEESLVYPPSSIQDIIRISLLADVDTHLKHFFILYFLQDLLCCLSSEKFHLDAEAIIKNYEAAFMLHEGQMRIVLSYRDIDCANFKDGIERLLHRTVKNSDIDDWEHRHIILTLYNHCEYSLAFRYLKGMQPPLGTTDDIKMEISLNVSLGNVSSAFFITQQWLDKRSSLLKHFFEECVKMNKIKFIYPLPLDKYEEESFLEFLRTSGIKGANDLMLYFYIDRHRYPEAFVLYDQMKRLGQCNGHDKNSLKRNMIMRSLEAKFDPKLLLLQKSKCEAKNTRPPSGFFEENWKPTSHYLKFDDSNPKKPLLKSSIKELAYITVWQGQKLSRMAAKDNKGIDEDSAAPLVERVKVLEKSELSNLGRKRLSTNNNLIGLSKKPKLLDRLIEKMNSHNEEPVTPSKKNLNISFIQEMVSTPRVEQKTPRRLSPTPGPPSILRVRSGKKEEVSSCDESTTPKKRLTFTLPSSSNMKNQLNTSEPLNLHDMSEDNLSEESDYCGESNEHMDESIKSSPHRSQDVENNGEPESFSNIDDFSVEDKKSYQSEFKLSQNSPIISMEDQHVSLEKRLQQLQNRNRKPNSFMNDILNTSKEDAVTDKDVSSVAEDEGNNDIPHNPLEGNEDCNQFSESEISNIKNVSQRGPVGDPSLMESSWQIESSSMPTISEQRCNIIDNNSVSSDSMDKVYTSVGAPVRKLSTIFETEGENEEPCAINVENVGNDQKDNIQEVYQVSELGDEKLDQDCDYNIQFGHENYVKNFDSESENNNEDLEEESKSKLHSENNASPEVKKKHSTHLGDEKSNVPEDNEDSNESDVICLGSDSEDNQNTYKEMPSNQSKYNRSDESSCKSSFSQSQDDEHSEADEYDEESDESVDEDEDVDDLKDESDVQLSNNEESRSVHSESEDSDVESIQESSDFPKEELTSGHVTNTDIYPDMQPSDEDKGVIAISDGDGDGNNDNITPLEEPSVIISPIIEQIDENISDTSEADIDAGSPQESFNLGKEKLSPLSENVPINLPHGKNISNVAIKFQHETTFELPKENATPLVDNAGVVFSEDVSSIDKVPGDKGYVSEVPQESSFHSSRTNLTPLTCQVGVVPSEAVPISGSSDEKNCILDKSDAECLQKSSLYSPEKKTPVIENSGFVSTEAVLTSGLTDVKHVSDAEHQQGTTDPPKDEIIIQKDISAIVPIEVCQNIELSNEKETVTQISVTDCHLESTVVFPNVESSNHYEVITPNPEKITSQKDSSRTLTSETSPHLICSDKLNEITLISDEDSNGSESQNISLPDPQKKNMTHIEETGRIVTPKNPRPNKPSDELKITTSVNQVDLSLLEKIVSFSKTVSEEQLKGLVDVVKTTFDPKKCVTINNSENDIKNESPKPNFGPSNNSHIASNSTSTLSCGDGIDQELAISRNTPSELEKSKCEPSLNPEVPQITTIVDFPAENISKLEPCKVKSNLKGVNFSQQITESDSLISCIEIEHYEKDDFNKGIVEKDKIIESYVEKGETGKDIVEKDEIIEGNIEKEKIDKGIVEKDEIIKDNVEKVEAEKMEICRDIIEVKEIDVGIIEKQKIDKQIIEKVDIDKGTVEKEQNILDAVQLQPVNFDTSLITDHSESLNDKETLEKVVSETIPNCILLDTSSDGEAKNDFIGFKDESHAINETDSMEHCKSCESNVQAEEIQVNLNDAKESDKTLEIPSSLPHLVNATGKDTESLVTSNLNNQKRVLSEVSKEVLTDNSDVHMLTVIEGKKVFCTSNSDKNSSPLLKVQEHCDDDQGYSFAKTVYEQSSGDIGDTSGDIGDTDTSIGVSDLNTAMVLEESYSVNTPRSQKKTFISNQYSKNLDFSIDDDEFVKKKIQDESDMFVKTSNEELEKQVCIADSSQDEIHKGNQMDANILETLEVGREVKQKSKSRKKVEMIDKCIMTDRKKHSTRKESVSRTSNAPINTKQIDFVGQEIECDAGEKPKLVDRSMLTDKRGIDFTIMESEVQVTPRRSKRRSSSLQPDDKKFSKKNLDKTLSGSVDSVQIIHDNEKDVKKEVDTMHQESIIEKEKVRNDGSQDPSKPSRVIKKAFRRSLKNVQSKPDVKSSNPETSEQPEIASEASNVLLSESDDVKKKPIREIRKALRRRSSVVQESSLSLVAIPENNELVIEPDNVSHHSVISLQRLSRSSSEPDVSSFQDDILASQNKRTPKKKSLGKCSSTEELSSESHEGTPRRSRRVSKPTEFFSPSSRTSDHSDLTDKKSKMKGKMLDFDDEPESSQSSIDVRKAPRKSRLSLRTNLEDIVEVSESDLDSTNSGEQYQHHVHNLRKRHTSALYEPHSKTDLTLLAMQKAGSSRRRTLSSSSEPHATGSDSEHNSVHYLRSYTRSEVSDSTVGSYSPHGKVKLKPSKYSYEDAVLHNKMKRSHENKNIKIHIKESEISGEDSDAEAPPYSPLTIENTSPKHKVLSEEDKSKLKKGMRRSKVSSAVEGKASEHGMPARIRRRTLSSSSEPASATKLSNVGETDETGAVQNRRKSLSGPLGRLTGLDLLKACETSNRRSRSLHDGNQIHPYKPTQLELIHGEDTHLKHQSSSQSPQLANIIDEYSENRRLTRHQKSLIERSFENSPATPELAATPKRKRRSSIVAGSEDESTPVRSSKRLQEKAHKKDG